MQSLFKMDHDKQVHGSEQILDTYCKDQDDKEQLLYDKAWKHVFN